MKIPLAKVFFWLPRGLGILTGVFISLFALDVFSMEGTALEKIGAFFLHLIPTYLLIIALLIGWHWERVGAALFIGLAVVYMAMTVGRLPVTAAAQVASLPAMVGFFFWADWAYRRGNKAAA